MHEIAAIVASSNDPAMRETMRALAQCELISDIAVAVTPAGQTPGEATTRIEVPTVWSTAAVVRTLRWLEGTKAESLLWVLSGAPCLSSSGVARLLRCANDAGAAIVYSDYFDVDGEGTTRVHPLIDYQLGSLRDDFDFGPVVLLSRAQLRGLADQMSQDLRYGAWYDLRLRLAERGSVLRVPEPLYQMVQTDLRTSGEKQFDYVDPKRRDYQVEMEQVATAYLRRIGAWLPPPAQALVSDDSPYRTAASVVIPVKNRVKTVQEAVRSALTQQTSFDFNVIVVDNHSNDGTTAVLRELSAGEPRLVHLQPRRLDLGIGGCWNEAVFSEQCGRFAVQLDSDDIYSGPDVLERVVVELQQSACAMLIGSYTTVSFDLEPLPPGLVDHREWTEQNGHNNALRIAGLGAPRAFHVPTLRHVGGFPDVSYGEDYAVGLRLSRSYRLARIFQSLYLCRRWTGNTDSALPLETTNRHAAYKDRLRTIEIAARQLTNRS